MSPLISQPAAPSALRLVSLGPITLPTVKGDVVEALGDQLDVVGAGVAPGNARPRPRLLRFPVRGDRLDADRRDAGLRLRRQVRSLMENADARLQGLYLNWAVDAELNGWLLVGGGDLKYAQAGVTFADFELELTDCYVVANRRTHRPARRALRFDRRSASVARDYLGTLYSADFAAVTPAARHYLGVSVTDVVTGSTRAPATVGTLAASDGTLSYVDALADGDVVHFEQAEGDLHRAIVRAYDSHGSATDTDWEPAYGPDQPLAGTPLLHNGVCRAIPDVAAGTIDVQSWSGAAWTLDATIAHPAGATSFACRVLEWTADRAVLLMNSSLSAGVRGELYLTLQRGWTGPRAELYARDAAGAATATLNVYAKTSGAGTWQRSSAGPTAISAGVSVGTFAAIEPWVALLGPGTDRGVAVAMMAEAVNLRGAAVLAGRPGLAFESPIRYVSVAVGLGPRASAAADAQTFGRQALYDCQQVPELVARL